LGYVQQGVGRFGRWRGWRGRGWRGWLEAALDLVSEVGWWQLADGELAEAVRVLARCESRSAAAGVGVLGEAMGRGLPVAAGARTGGQWLRGLVPVSAAAARARAGLAEALHPRCGL
jgi:hypothetical protein